MNGRPGRTRGEEAVPGQELAAPRRAPAPTRSEAVRGVAEEIRGAGVPDGRLEAERLVAHAIGVERSELLLHTSERLTVAEAGRLAEAVKRRIKREPLQHIEGSAAFRELALVSDRRALIPRPETEQLVEQVVRWARAGAPLARGLDVGTGSGAIALALLTEGVVQHMVGVDLSIEALGQAEENRRRADVSETVFELREASDGPWSAIRPDERFDVIVSNPPYVREAEIATLPPEVRDYEPRVALAGGADGMAMIREMAARAGEHLCEQGAVFLEFGEGQAELARALFEARGVWKEISIDRDLTGRERFLRAVID